MTRKQISLGGLLTQEAITLLKFIVVKKILQILERSTIIAAFLLVVALFNYLNI